ncbi:hypothetical protein L6259_00720 [Candidatus Parcubacteria bacterium]|nr:hypothetical protein [Patescibacteria group bacterium]MCG2693795.1 hypothetical protein [Candidatus Parcubacteria bacterium]
MSRDTSPCELGYYDVIDGLVCRRNDITAKVAALIQKGRYAEALMLQKAVSEDEYRETVASAEREVDMLVMDFMMKR